MDDYRKLHNQPLRFVLAEFRFSTVMDMSTYIPKLQDALRKLYPTPDKKNEQSVQIQQDGISVSTIDRWSFMSANKKNAIDINQDRLIYCTSEYPRFEGFSNNCKHALETLINIVDPSLILRIGLRYGDLVKVDDGEQATDLVDPYFTFPNYVNQLGKAEHQKIEVFLTTELGGLAIRTLYGTHNLTCLPDIQGLPVTIEADDIASERLVLDFDHFWDSKDESITFEINDILQKLTSLHKTSRAAFWKATTDYARNTKWS